MTAFRSALYRGELLHARHDAFRSAARPREHLGPSRAADASRAPRARRAFRYPVYIAALDLAELPALHRELRLFSHRRRNLFSFDERDYAATLSPSRRATTSGPAQLLDSLAALREANGLPVPATTRLVTNLRVAGYVFNPVSFFLDYDARGTVTSAIAEVNNTYGGRLRYVLSPRTRIERRGSRDDGDRRLVRHDAAHQPARVGFRHVRELFVSPFLHGPATYDFWFDAPLDGEALAIEMHVHRGATDLGDTRLFTAGLTGTRAPLSDRTLLAAALRYPLMTAQVIGLIHLEAMRLRVAGVPYHRPGRDHRPLSI